MLLLVLVLASVPRPAAKIPPRRPTPSMSMERTVVGKGASPFYSAAQVHGSTVYASGQIGWKPGTKDFAEGGIEGQTRQVLENLQKVLKDAGSDFSKTLKTTCYLNSIDDYPGFNKVYMEFFPDVETRPARVCFGPGGLPFGALVEVDAIAFI